MQDETGPSFDMERGADDKENAKLTHGCCPIFHVQDDDYFRPVDGPMHMLYPAVPLQQGQGSQGERSIAKSQESGLQNGLWIWREALSLAVVVDANSKTSEETTPGPGPEPGTGAADAQHQDGSLKRRSSQ